ncbi:MAG: 50S ribosomal protein P1 [archaeon]|nr:50S ribosomal protein P1 [archaeon]
MEYIYSAMVLYAAGKDITEDAVKAILKSAGIEPDVAKVKSLIASLEGVDIKEAIASATSMTIAPTTTAAPATAAPEAKKEEQAKEEQVSEEEAAAGLSALFG